jgi:hypothetical protein
MHLRTGCRGKYFDTREVKEYEDAGNGVMSCVVICIKTGITE